MALADPQSITYDGTAISLPRTGQGNNEGTFTSSDGNYQLSVRHSYGSTNRHSVKITRKTLTASPTTPANNINTLSGVNITVTLPSQGVTVAEAQKLLKALLASLSASTYAIADAIVSGQS